MKPIRRNAWVGLLALLWLAIVFAVYYAVHKPFAPSTALNVARAAGQLAIALGIITLGGGIGTCLLPGLTVSPLAGFALRGALGVGLLSIIILLIGATIGTSPILSWLGLLIPAVILRRSIYCWWQALADLRQLWKVSGRLGKTIAGLSVLIFCSTLFVALAPAIKFDALVYHLTLPRWYITAGRVEYVPWNMFWGMPQVGEMLYIWAMSLAGEGAAVCLGWGIGLLGVLGLLGYARVQVGVAAAWVSVASLLAGYTTASELSWAYVDWFTILFGLVFLVALHAWLEKGRTHHLLLAGLFGGFAFGSKYSAAALLVAGTVIIAYHSLRWSTLRRSLVNLAEYSLVAVAATAPWLLKNMLATGNPLYPFLVPSGEMDAYRLELYQNFPVWSDWREVLLLPWQATFTGHEGAPGYSASIGPLLLALVMVYITGLFLKVDPKLRKLQPAAALAGLGLVMWALAGRTSGYLIQTRLYLVFFPALALLAGGGYRVLFRIELPGVRLGRIAGVLVVFALALNSLKIGLDTLSKGAVQTVAGLRSEQDYLNANLGWYAPTTSYIQDLPAEASVLMLWEPRSLYCLPRCRPDEVLDRWRRDLNTWGDAESVLLRWRESGFSHLLVHNQGVDFIRLEDEQYTDREWQALDELLTGLKPTKEFGEAYTLYQLRP